MKEAAQQLEAQEIKHREKQHFRDKLAAGEEGARGSKGPEPAGPAHPLPDVDLPAQIHAPHEAGVPQASRAPQIKVPATVRELFPKTGPFTVRFRLDQRKVGIDFRF